MQLMLVTQKKKADFRRKKLIIRIFELKIDYEHI